MQILSVSNRARVPLSYLPGLEKGVQRRELISLAVSQKEHSFHPGRKTCSSCELTKDCHLAGYPWEKLDRERSLALIINSDLPACQEMVTACKTLFYFACTGRVDSSLL